MIYYQRSGINISLSRRDLREGLFQALDKLGKRNNVLAVPPDITRLHSCAGELTSCSCQYYGRSLTAVLPALGTHTPMTSGEINRMFPGIPHRLFRKHKWQTDLTTLGTVPASFLTEVSEGKITYDWPAQVNKILTEGRFDLILSLGQVVPHGVVGMANHSKNILIGTGGAEGIHRSHFLGAVYGMERIMGHTDSPVRSVLDYAINKFAGELPILYVLTVVSLTSSGEFAVRGLFIGDGRECFEQAAALSRKVNFTIVEKPIKKCFVYLNPEIYRSTWLGNKAIYRTRMAMADEGEIIISGPGLSRFGENREIDRLIRRYGYCGTPSVLSSVRQNADLKASLSTAAHLIHGSSEGRFRITCASKYLSRKDIQGVGYNYADLNSLAERYNPSSMKPGWNNVKGEEVYFITNPAMGMWTHPDRFSSTDRDI